MRYKVYITAHAERDIEDIYDYLAKHHSADDAYYVFDRLQEIIERLERYPDRGAVPKELATLGIQEFREVFFKPYRVIYRIVESRVYVYIVADGRRNMQSLLARRLLR